jgi:CubicO group peptidase (beta-lactamase class C family)
VRAAVGRPLSDYLSDRIWTPAGMADTARWWLDSPDGVEIGGSGISATLRDYARFGQFILDDGIIGTDTVLPRGWVREATAPVTLSTGKTIDYGYLWWPATTESGRRDRAFSAVGIHGQLLYVNPAARVVIVSWGAHPAPGGSDDAAEQAFIDAVVEALRPFTARDRAAR